MRFSHDIIKRTSFDVGIVASQAQCAKSVTAEKNDETEGLCQAEARYSAEHGKTSFERLRMALHRDRPLPEQIARQIAFFLAGGALLPGERLPPVAAAAQHFGVAGHTMAQAYQILRRNGISTNTPSTGTYFTSGAERAARRYLLSSHAHEFIRQGHALELDGNEIVGVFLATQQRFESQKFGHDTRDEEP